MFGSIATPSRMVFRGPPDRCIDQALVYCKHLLENNTDYNIQNSLPLFRRLPHRLPRRSWLVPRHRRTRFLGSGSGHAHRHPIRPVGQHALQECRGSTPRIRTSRGSPSHVNGWLDSPSHRPFLVRMDQQPQHTLDCIDSRWSAIWLRDDPGVLGCHELPHRCLYHLRCQRSGCQFSVEKYVRHGVSTFHVLHVRGSGYPLGKFDTGVPGANVCSYAGQYALCICVKVCAFC